MISKCQDTMLSTLNKFTYISEERTIPIFRVCPRMQNSFFLRNSGHFLHHTLKDGLFRNVRCANCLKIIDRSKSEIYLSCSNSAVSFIPAEKWKTDENMLIWFLCFRILVTMWSPIIQAPPLDCISVL